MANDEGYERGGRRSILGTYLKEIAKYPLLSRDEEIEYARRYKENGDEEARAQ